MCCSILAVKTESITSVIKKNIKMSLDVNISEPEEFNCTQLHSVIQEVAKLKGIEDFSYHVDTIGGKGESYVANTFRVVISQTDNDNNSFKVIVKTLINTTRQEMFHELHKREVSVYKELIPVYNDIQRDGNMANQVILPECFLSCSEKGNEILILEDLKEDGWETDKTFRNFEELDYEKVHLAIRELAKLHSLSFVFENQHPDKFSELKSQFDDVIFNDRFLNNSKLRHYFQESFESSLKLISDVDARKKLETIKPKLVDILKQYVKPNKYNVFCHGDFWINNMLFKYEENKPTAVCFLDFQVVRYACPVIDIIYFIYLCTTTNFRSEYLDKIKSEYYDSLKTHLQAYKIDVNSVYPLKEFDNDIKEALPFGLIMAIIELKLVTTTTEDEAILKGAHIDHDSDLTKVPGEDKLLQLRLDEVVQESIDNGVIDKLLSKLQT